MDSIAYHQLGLKLEAQQKYAEAIDSYTKAIDLAPENSLLYLARASALYNGGNPHQALSDLDRTIKLNPELARAYEFRADIKHRLGDNAGAINDYSSAIRLNPKQAMYYIYRGHLNKAVGRTLDMINDYYNAVSLDEQCFRLVLAPLSLKKKLETMDRIISEFPTHPEAYALRAHLRFKALDYFGGVEDISQALHLRPDDARFLMLRSVVHVGQDDWVSAIADLNEAIRIDPEMPDAYAQRGIIWTKLGDNQKAIIDLEYACQMDSKLAREYREFLENLKGVPLTNEKEEQLVKPSKRPERVISFDAEIPLRLQMLIRDTVQAIRQHPSHQFLPAVRRAFYDSLSPDPPFAMQAEGWLAVIAARRVLPLFKNAIPDEHSPEELLELAEALLRNQADRASARTRIAEEHYIAGNLWGYAFMEEDEMPVNVMFAGWAAHRAVQEAYGTKPLTRLGQFYMFKGNAEDKQVISGKEWTDLEAAPSGQGDAASCAAMAVSCDSAGRCDPEKLREFWEWWLIDAVPLAWESAMKTTASSNVEDNSTEGTGTNGDQPQPSS